MKLVWDRESDGTSTSKLKMDDGDGLMTIREAAASIRVSEETIRMWMRNGYIPFQPVGAFRMIRKADLYSKDAADGMPTARPRTDNKEPNPHGSQAVHPATDTEQPKPEPASTEEVKAADSPPRSGSTGQGKRHKGGR